MINIEPLKIVSGDTNRQIFLTLQTSDESAVSSIGDYSIYIDVLDADGDVETTLTGSVVDASTAAISGTLVTTPAVGEYTVRTRLEKSATSYKATLHQDHVGQSVKLLIVN